MTRIAEVRLVDENGEYGDVLPDWTALSYQDDADDVGAVTLTYPLGGLHAKKILPFQEMALFLDGRELPNGRFRLDQNEGDPISDGAGSLQWAGQTLMGRLATAMIAPDIVKKKEGGKEAADEERSNRDTRETSRDSERERRSDDVHLEDDGDRTAVRTAADDRAKDKEQKDDEDQKKRNPPQGHKFEKATPGEVVLRLARSAKRRGAIPEIRFGFTATHDSDGNKWRKEDDITRRFDVGSSLLDVVKWLAEADKAEARMETRTLNLYRRYTGRDRTGRGVMLAYGKNLGDGPRQADGRGLVNAVFAVSDTGLHGWVADKDLVDRDGRIEGLLSVKGVKHWEDLRDLAKKHIGKFGQIREQRTYAVKPGLGADPYLDYQVGDWLLLLEGSEPERVRVQAVTVEFTTSGLSSASVTLRDKVKSRFAQTAAGLSALMGATQSVHGGVALVANPTTRSNLQPVDDVPTKPAAPAVVARAGTAAVVTDGAKETGYLTNFAVEHIEVHVSEDEDFEPDDASYVGVLTGPGVLAVNGATVDQALYSRLVAVDVNGERSEPSDATAFESVRVTGADLAESTVTYREIAARTISGDLFQEDVVLSTRFSTGTIDAEGNISGARVDIAPEGLALTGADEQMLAVFPTTGARPFIDGDFVTRTLRVLEGASFESSANQVARGAAVVLASGVAAPAVSPLLREHWESVTLDTAVHAGPLSLFGSFAFNGSAVTGFAYCNGQYVIAQAVSLYYSNGRVVPPRRRLPRRRVDGHHCATHRHRARVDLPQPVLLVRARPRHRGPRPTALRDHRPDARDRERPVRQAARAAEPARRVRQRHRVRHAGRVPREQQRGADRRLHRGHVRRVPGAEHPHRRRRVRRLRRARCVRVLFRVLGPVAGEGQPDHQRRWCHADRDARVPDAHRERWTRVGRDAVPVARSERSRLPAHELARVEPGELVLRVLVVRLGAEQRHLPRDARRESSVDPHQPPWWRDCHRPTRPRHG
jgi:hypothetical protein